MPREVTLPDSLAIARSRRSVRVFLSSTFRDFGEERDLLIRRVFAALRRRLADRFVELVDVDLRWGITAEQAERGEVLGICLAEIERARPFFVGLLGERYGWVPPKASYPEQVVSDQPWLGAYTGDKSVTELEILHGVLNNPQMAGRALFYFRSAAYARHKGGDYLPSSPEDARRQKELKSRITGSGFPVHRYRTPADLARRLEEDLWSILDETFPASEVPDAFERESMRHEAYAAPRRRLYLGGEGYIDRLLELLVEGRQWILIEGASGGGKSALLANALERYRRDQPEALVHAHYLSATSDEADTPALVRRLIESIRRTTGSADAIASDTQGMFDSLPTWLATASAWAGMHGRRFVFVLDGINGIRGYRDLRWFPSYLPERVQAVVSCLAGDVLSALETKAEWTRIRVEPLTPAGRRELLATYLSHYNKRLPDDLQELALSHPLADNPLWLRTLAEELRLFGSHEELSARLRTLLGPPQGKAPDEAATVDDLFEHVLARVEQDIGRRAVHSAMTGLWASRAGLSEPELLGLTGLKPAQWARIRLATDDMLLESAGRLVFAHDYIRTAVRDRYLPGEDAQRRAHARVATYFAALPVDGRVAEEVPWQLRAAGQWRRLERTLTDHGMFRALVDHGNEEEHRGYWLSLETHESGLRMESAFERAWPLWQQAGLDEKALADVAGELASFLREAGRYRGKAPMEPLAIRLARHSLAIAEKVHGPAQPETSARLDNLANLLRATARYDQAEPLYRRALAICESAQGPEDPDTGSCLHNLAGLLEVRERYEEAEPLMRRALAIAEKAQGPEHRERGSRLNSLAELLRRTARYEEAEPLYRRALAIAETVQGPEHPDTGMSLNNLALLLYATTREQDSESLLRRALAIAEKVLGPEHPSTGKTCNSLAVLLDRTGRHAEAEPLYRRALAITEKARGPEHPTTGMFLNRLAEHLQETKRYEEAEPLYRRALAIAETVQGPEHSDTLSSLDNLARVLAATGRDKEAELFYRRSLAITEKALGTEHTNTGIRLFNLALLLDRTGRHAEAEPLYRRGLAIVEKALGAAHPDTRATSRNLRRLLHQLGRKPDPALLVSSGNFLSVVAYAKAIAMKLGAPALATLHLLAGVELAERHDGNWGEEIGRLLSPELRKHALEACDTMGIDPQEELAPLAAKMPLAEDLKRFIGAHARSGMKEFLEALAECGSRSASRSQKED